MFTGNEGSSIEEMKREYLRFMPENLGKCVDILDRMGFFVAPASIKYHGAFTGGLFCHSMEVAKQLVGMTMQANLKWERVESPYIIGMFHDLCKTESYEFDSDTGVWFYKKDRIMPDHGALSIILAQKMIQLTEEEIACIRWHMGAFEKDSTMWEYYNNAIKRYPNVLFAHTADMIASKIAGV